MAAPAIEAGPHCTGIHPLFAEAAPIARRTGALKADRKQAARGAILAGQREAVVHTQHLQVGLSLKTELRFLNVSYKKGGGFKSVFRQST